MTARILSIPGKTRGHRPRLKKLARTGGSMQTAVQQVMPEALLRRCADRAADYDRDNLFFTEDFEELRLAGYLLTSVPAELGGWGMMLPDVCREQRRLAYYAPATALGINMHLYWMGVAADLWRAGDR